MEFISGLVNAQHDLVCVGTGTRRTCTFILWSLHMSSTLFCQKRQKSIYKCMDYIWQAHFMFKRIHVNTWYRAVKRETCLFCKKIFKKHSQIKYSFIVYLLQNKLFLVLLSFNDVNSRLWSFADLLLDLKHVTCTHTW